MAKGRATQVDPIRIGGRVGYLMMKAGPDPARAERNASWWWKVHDGTGREVKRDRSKATLTRAQEACKAWMLIAERGDARAADPTVGDLVGEYMAARAAGETDSKAESTLRIDREIASAIPQWFMSKPVSQVKREHGYEVNRELLNESPPRAERTRAKVQIFIRAVWLHGLDRGLTETPCPTMGITVKIRKKVSWALSHEEEAILWKAALKYLDAAPSWAEAARDVTMISLMAFCGYRIGEACGTRVGDVSVANRTIQMGGHVVEGVGWKPGSKNGPDDVRTLPLLRHSADLVVAAAEARVGDDPGLPLLPTEAGGWVDPSNLRRTLDRIAKRAGIPTTKLPGRLHDTAATRLGEAGVHARVQGEMMEHSAAMAGLYTQVAMPWMMEAARSLEKHNEGR